VCLTSPFSGEIWCPIFYLCTAWAKSKPCRCINNIAKGSKKQQQPFFARFFNDFVEVTASDIQKTKKKQLCCLPFGKADDTASAALARLWRVAKGSA
jgi:hypothetical protein